MYKFKDANKSISDLKKGDVLVFLSKGIPTKTYVEFELADWDDEGQPYMETLFMDGRGADADAVVGLRDTSYKLKDLDGVLYIDVAEIETDMYNWVNV